MDYLNPLRKGRRLLVVILLQIGFEGILLSDFLYLDEA
jgi:hypothetical protein